ncbi:hypothetical protein LTR53_001784 [Teratosphaeriaceae sp. CCFEE 6253]|nr:hypothetical protein LTR53_001784 [Teratosphaeriaceae sp. CCFEE 6253]
MANAFPQIRAAAIDGRAHNVYYRQIQLEQLCHTLIDNATKLQEAIARDHGHSLAEIAVELSLAIRAIRHDYASLSQKQTHTEEYRVALGEDAPDGARPVGIVYIEPCAHTLLFSVVVPLSAAIAAGNCVIVLLENDLHETSSLLRRVLSSALDPDTFAVASSPVREKVVLDLAITVDQRSGQRWPQSNQVSSLAEAHTIAIVDRTGNPELAAHELVAARFSFGGRSPYAPDVVLVNEFSRQAFLSAAVAECIKYGSSTKSSSDAETKSNIARQVSKRIEALRQADPGLRVIVQESKFAVVEITSRNPELLVQKSAAPVLVLHAFRSLDDAIDLVNSASQDRPALAAYHFSNTASAKYLTQFIDAHLSLVNHIPREILVGPAFPTAHPIDLAVRYPPHLFSERRPAYVKPAARSELLQTALASENHAAAKALMAEAMAPLAMMKRHPGGGVGFFEQGFLMSTALILTTTISVTGAGVYWAWRYRRAL